MGIEPTGATIEGNGMTLIRFEDGVAIKQWNNGDTLSTMQQLGVVEMPGD